MTAASAAMTEASLALLAGDTGYWDIRFGYQIGKTDRHQEGKKDRPAN